VVLETELDEVRRDAPSLDGRAADEEVVERSEEELTVRGAAGLVVATVAARPMTGGAEVVGVWDPLPFGVEGLLQEVKKSSSSPAGSDDVVAVVSIPSTWIP
jgi:hypothetical protein